MKGGGRGRATELLADLVAIVGSRRYLCGTGGAKYLDLAPFADSGVAVEYFVTPRDTSSLWRASNRITGLWSVMIARPERLAAELRAHAGFWRA